MANVNALFPRVNPVTLNPEEVVNVAFACRDKLVGAVNVVDVVLRVPFNTRVVLAPPRSNVPPVGVPDMVTLPPETLMLPPLTLFKFEVNTTEPPVLEMIPLDMVGAEANVRLLPPVMICSPATFKVTGSATTRLVPNVSA